MAGPGAAGFRLISGRRPLSLLPTPAPAHALAVGGVGLFSGSVAQGRDAPLGDGVPPGSRLALAAAVGVVDRVHRRAASLRPDSLVPVAARLADGDVLVVRVADRADRGATLRGHHP